MSDATGKATGKRVLDNDGNWRTVSSLPKEVQAEIKKNNKKADADRRDQALAGNETYQNKKAEDEKAELRKVIKELKAATVKKAKA